MEAGRGRSPSRRTCRSSSCPASPSPRRSRSWCPQRRRSSVAGVHVGISDSPVSPVSYAAGVEPHVRAVAEVASTVMSSGQDEERRCVQVVRVRDVGAVVESRGLPGELEDGELEHVRAGTQEARLREELAVAVGGILWLPMFAGLVCSMTTVPFSRTVAAPCASTQRRTSRGPHPGRQDEAAPVQRGRVGPRPFQVTSGAHPLAPGDDVPFQVRLDDRRERLPARAPVGAELGERVETAPSPLASATVT